MSDDATAAVPARAGNGRARLIPARAGSQACVRLPQRASRLRPRIVTGVWRAARALTSGA